MQKDLYSERLSDELVFTTSKSGGPGGQHVNKVETKVTLRFDVLQSKVLSALEKVQIVGFLSRYLTKEGVLVLSAQASRSQFDNKQMVVDKFNVLLTSAFTKKKIRKSTKPSAGSVKKRLASKKAHSEKKKWRQSP